MKIKQQIIVRQMVTITSSRHEFIGIGSPEESKSRVRNTWNFSDRHILRDDTTKRQHQKPCRICPHSNGYFLKPHLQVINRKQFTKKN